MTDYAALAAEAATVAVSVTRRDPLEASGLTALAVGCDLLDVAQCLERLPALLNGTDPLGRRVIRKLIKLRRVRGLLGSSWRDQQSQEQNDCMEYSLLPVSGSSFHTSVTSRPKATYQRPTAYHGRETYGEDHAARQGR